MDTNIESIIRGAHDNRSNFFFILNVTMRSVSSTKDVEQFNLLLFNHTGPFHHNVLPFNSSSAHPRDSTSTVFCKSKVPILDTFCKSDFHDFFR